MKPNNKWLAVLSLIASIVLAEVALRCVFKIIPGMHVSSHDFQVVDSLYTLKGFYADSEGIFKISPQTKIEIESRIASSNKSNEQKLYDWQFETSEVYCIIDELRQLKAGKIANNFARKYNTILNLPFTSLSETDTAILHYVNHPINDDGFQSIPFKNFTGGKKKILLLGDSFTWGRTVNNITSSFANELLAMGYTVYNTGISGADPPQYLAIAQKYIPLLKPDVVIVNFYMGNDIAFFKRELLPYHALMYCTNAGYLMGNSNGIWFNSAEETYNFVKEECNVPSTNLFNKICSATATGTLLWRFLLKQNFVENYHPEQEEYNNQAANLSSDIPFCNEEMKEIIKISGENNAKCVVSVIRDMAHENQYDPKQVHNLFTDVPYVISSVGIDGYSKGDWHFNEKGHSEYALFLDSICRNTK